jgi:hypothetical protein
MPKKTEPRLKKITINLPTKLYNEINQLAIENGQTFTGQLTNILQNGIDQKIAIDLMPQLFNEYMKSKQEDTKKTKKRIKA